MPSVESRQRSLSGCAGFNGASRENGIPSIVFRSRLMKQHRCRYCRQAFHPNRYHPQQQVCNQPACQSQRRSDYHRQKMVSDPVYRQVCLESPRKWREANPGYWKKYRQNHPRQVERNRRQQRLRDQKRRLANLANNNLAISQVLIFQCPYASEQASSASCKQHLSGAAASAAV